MTPDELMAMSTRSAEESVRVSSAMLEAQLAASEQIQARGVSDAISKAAVELLKNPTS